MKINNLLKNLFKNNKTVSQLESNVSISSEPAHSHDVTMKTKSPEEILGRSMLLGININQDNRKEIEIPDLTNDEFLAKLENLRKSNWNNMSLVRQENLLNKNNIFLAEQMVNDGYIHERFLHELMKKTKTKSDTKRLLEIYNALKDKNLNPTKMGITLSEVNSDNYLFALDLCNDKFIDKRFIVPAVSNYDTKESVECKKKVYELLKKYDNLAGAVCVSQILSVTNQDTFDLVNLLVSDNDFPKDRISDCVKIDEPEFDFDLRADIYNLLKANSIPSSIAASVLSSTNYENINFVKKCALITLFLQIKLKQQ